MAQLSTVVLIFCVAFPIFIASAQKQCSQFSFSRNLNTKLQCGIFKTLMFVDPIECHKKCVAAWSCFSVNTYQSDNGTEMCDLIRGSKKSFDIPDCLVRQKESEHNELDSSSPCSFTGSCEENQIRKALPGFWYQLDSSAFKIFDQKKNYAEADAVCSANGGFLATINSETENRFVAELYLAEQAAKTDIIIHKTLKPFKRWKLDGSDPDVTVHRDAQKDKNNSAAALHFPGTAGSYATTPAWDISRMTFSIAIWLKLETIPPSKYLFYSRWSNPQLFVLYSHKDRLKFAVRKRDLTENLFICDGGKLTANEWTHVVAVWNRATKQATLYQDGANVSKFKPLTTSELDLPAPNSHDQVFDLGYNRDNGTVMKGWLRELFVFDRAVTSEEVNIIKDATMMDQKVWIGAPQNYPIKQPETNCLSMSVWGTYQRKEMPCDHSVEFICERPV